MASKRINTYSLTIVLLFSSCKKLTIAEYKVWFSDESNGYTKTKNVDNLVYTAYYRTSEYSAVNALQSSERKDKKTYDSLIANFSNGIQFVYEIAPSSQQQTISQLMEGKDVQQLSTAAQYFSLVVDNDTLYPEIFHYEREFEIGKKITYVLSFPKRTIQKEMQLIYTDHIFNKGSIKMVFDDRKNLPENPFKF